MNTAEKLARRVLESFHSGDIDAVGGLVTEDFVDHGAPPWAPQGRAGYVQLLKFLVEALEPRYETHDIVASGDRVAIRATLHGVHKTDLLGFAPTGRTYAMPTMHLYREQGGLLAEHWGVRDELSVLWQVGALAPPQPFPLVAS